MLRDYCLIVVLDEVKQLVIRDKSSAIKGVSRRRIKVIFDVTDTTPLNAIYPMGKPIIAITAYGVAPFGNLSNNTVYFR